jgi:adenylate cyclase
MRGGAVGGHSRWIGVDDPFSIQAKGFMHRITTTQSILVATICGFSRFRKMLGSDQFLSTMGQLFCHLNRIARNLDGEIVQTAEDKLMCAFASADAAVAAATMMHQFVASHPQPALQNASSIGLEVRIGTGTVLREGDHLSGDAVQWAMYGAASCTPHRTLISETTMQYLSRANKNRTHFLARWPTKEHLKFQSVFEYIGDEEDTTLAQDIVHTQAKMEALDIIHGPVVMTMDVNCPVIRIGRLAENDLILNYPRVSRKHAKIENRRGKFALVDTSSNGTYVTIGDLDTILVIRDEIPLIGKGIISPGRKAASSSPGAIHFTVR